MTANKHITISKKNELPAGQDYYKLREEGIRLIQQLGSQLWTDYNIHDPGITILETLCYALTDLSYRSSLSIPDLLAKEKPDTFNADDQSFFTAREILTTAPWTIDDYRKLLIDLEGVHNAWLSCNPCNCGPKIYVNCKDSELTYTKPLPPENADEHLVVPKGLYNVQLEFDIDPINGDLNSGKISLSYNMMLGLNPETLYFEARFPSLRRFTMLEKSKPALKYFRHPGTKISKVTPILATFKDANKKTVDNALLATQSDFLKKALRSVMFVSLEITFDELVTEPSGKSHTVILTDVPFKLVWLKDEVRAQITLKILENVFTDNSESGFAARYLQKIQTANQVLQTATQALHSHRNITEDFCNIDEVDIEEFGVCTDMELSPSADIEQVLAQTYYLIAEYLNPSIRFFTLSEMLKNKTVDEVFDGPKLMHGFIEQSDLDRTVLNRTIYSSDIINLLMDIPGVEAVRNFVLLRFDDMGFIQESDPWQLPISPDKLPRLYLEGCKILAFKNGLPFLPDINELQDTMHVIYGNNSKPKLKDTDLDLPVPDGTYYDLKSYFAIQNSLPLVYGTGYEGLPDSASDERKGQARQLKAYLMFFEQLLVNYLGQLNNLGQLFSTSNTVRQTQFPILLKNNDISDIEILYDSLNELSLYQITESTDEFLVRRNKFLDHAIARFSESFSEYALLLYSYQEKRSVNSAELINIKTGFLKQFPYQSAFKAQSFDYTFKPDIDIRKDMSGLHNRISALLGLQPSLNFFKYDIQKTVISGNKNNFTTTLSLKDDQGNLWLTAQNLLTNDDRDGLIQDVNFTISEILRIISQKASYSVKPDGAKFKFELGSPAIAFSTGYADPAAANYAIDQLVDFAAKNFTDEKFIIVEHILLRPHEKNDALLDICVEPDCNFCGNENPYSYRITFVFNGESKLASEHFSFRRFAERTIRAELPAHVQCKICWVKKDTYISFEKAYINWLNDFYETPTATDDCKKKIGINNNALKNLICEFNQLHSIYPPATLHDCIDGNDVNPVVLNQTML